MRVRIILFGICLVLASAAARDAAADQPAAVHIATMAPFVGGQMQLVGVDYIIEQQGWLRDELSKRGIKLEWYPVANAAVGPLINEAFANHAIQFAGYGDLPAIIVNGNGAVPITRLLVPSSSRDAFLVVPANSTAKSIEDLKGKRVAIHKGRPWELPLLELLDSKHLSYADFQIYNINPDAGVAAVSTGAVDGLFTMSAYQLQDTGAAKIIWSTKEAPASWKMGMGFWGAKDFIDKYPDITQLVVTAYIKATQWVSEDENKSAVIKRDTVNGTSESAAARIYDDPSISWKDRWSPLFTPAIGEHYRNTISYAVDKKIIRKPVAVSDLIEPKFSLAALHSLNLDSYWAPPPGQPAAQAATSGATQ